MVELSYAVVDVFTTTPLSGNPLAVVMDVAEQLDAAHMAAIAIEFNLSETTFVRPADPTRADWWLRSFTPGGAEVAGAGHNALGAWWWLAITGHAAPPGARQLLGDRVLPVHIARDGHVEIGLDQGEVEFGEVTLDGGRLRSALGLGERTPLPQTHPVGSVGSPHLLVELPDSSTVDAARPDTAALRDVLASARAQGCCLFTTDAADADADARFFNPTVGILEDPATGSAAGPLAQLLHDRGGPREVSISQGRSMGRPSRLTVQVREAGPRLLGRCALAAEGTLHTD